MIKIVISEDDSTDQSHIRRVLSVNDAYSCIYEIKQEIRSILKSGFFNNKELNEEQMDFISHIQGRVFEICSDLPDQD